MPIKDKKHNILRPLLELYPLFVDLKVNHQDTLHCRVPHTKKKHIYTPLFTGLKRKPPRKHSKMGSQDHPHFRAHASAQQLLRPDFAMVLLGRRTEPEGLRSEPLLACWSREIKRGMARKPQKKAEKDEEHHCRSRIIGYDHSWQNRWGALANAL